MADAIEIDAAAAVRIPASAIEVQAVRASGPGGQNVNKVSSRIVLIVDPLGIEGLNEAALSRLLSLAGRRRDADGRIRITCQESRDRSRNLQTARQRVANLVAQALVVPKRRRPTKPSAGVREGRLREKRVKSDIKKKRRGASPELE